MISLIYMTLIQCAETDANMNLPTEKAAHKLKDAVSGGAKQAKEKGEEVKGEAAQYADKGKSKAEEALRK